MGGDVSLAAAPLLGNRVIGLIWVDTYPDNRLRTCAARLRILNEVSNGDFPTNVRRLVKNLFKCKSDPSRKRIATLMSSASPTIARSILTESLAFADEVQRRLDDLALPVLAINGHYPHPAEGAVLTGVDAERMPGVRHFPHLEDSKEFNRILRAVIKKVADRSLRGRTEM